MYKKTSYVLENTENEKNSLSLGLLFILIIVSFTGKLNLFYNLHSFLAIPLRRIELLFLILLFGILQKDIDYFC